MYPPPRVSWLTDTARALFLAAVAAFLVSGHSNADFEQPDVPENMESIAPVPQAYPIILISADCGKKFQFPELEPGQDLIIDPGVNGEYPDEFMVETLTLEVTPSSWGDAMENYGRAYMWMASVDMSIFKFRPDGTIHVLCHLVCVEEFHEGEVESLRPDLPPGKEDSSSPYRTVTVRVKQKDGGGGGGGVNVAGTGLQGQFNTDPGAHDLEFWTGSPISLDTIVAKGRGTYEGNNYLRTYGIICPLTIAASTSGRASAEWYEDPDNPDSDPAPADGVIAPAAWASHYSPDGTDENERCRKSLDQLGELP